MGKKLLKKKILSIQRNLVACTVQCLLSAVSPKREARDQGAGNAPGKGLSKGLSLAPRRPHPSPSSPSRLAASKSENQSRSLLGLCCPALRPAPTPAKSHNRDCGKGHRWGCFAQRSTFAPTRARTPRSLPCHGLGSGESGDAGLG